MRVAGTVIWATDLTEGAATTGAKGQPGSVYSYSVSFAVAVSSRPIKGIGRIRADGKLIRDEDGIFKVPVTFRFHDGDEQQELDPLIGSIEGIGSAPAYRGLAIAVFEDLELVEFGNRIPFITAEIFGDEAPPTVGAIFNDASTGLIACNDPQTVVGYAAHGGSMRAAIEPLIDALGIRLVEDEGMLRSPSSDLLVIDSEHELGASAEEPCPRFERGQLRASEMLTSVRLSFADPLRDYQQGEARASAGDAHRRETDHDLPAALDAGSAKAIAQTRLARAWAERDCLTLRLPPRYLAVTPGRQLDLPLTPSRWVVERSSLEGFVCVLEARPRGEMVEAMAADSGRAAPPVPDEGELTLSLFEAPARDSSGRRSVLLAASSPGPGWRSRSVEVVIGPHRFVERTASRKSTLGRATSSTAVDAQFVDVELIDRGQWLVSCDEQALAGGANSALLGNEMIQFSDAEPRAPGRFRLSGLVRGVGGTDGGSGAQEAGKAFVLLEQDRLRLVAIPPWLTASKVEMTETLIECLRTGQG